MEKSKNSSSAGGGIGLCGLVFVVFLTLKLAEIGAVAHWSWWWVTAPLWLPAGLLLSTAAVAMSVAVIAEAIKSMRWARRRRRRG